MLQLRRPLRVLALPVGVLALVLAVAGCGGGGNSNEGVASLGGKATTTSAGASGDRQQALDWARCMRQHGVDLPDPQFSGDNVGQQLPTRAEQKSAKFKAAEQACKQYLPNRGQPTQADSQMLQQALGFARCMRQHGTTNMPDPQMTAQGIDQPLPSRVDPDDPRLKAAEQACHQYGSLPPPKPGGPPTGGGGNAGGGK